MLTNTEIAKLYICRRCLNKYTSIKFKNYELNYKYYYYHFKCAKCGGMHHIVKGVKPLYAWKLFFTKRPTDLTASMDKGVERALKRKQIKIKLKKWLNW